MTWLVGLLVGFAAAASAEVSVTASVDRNRIGFGEAATFTITVQGSQSAERPAIPAVDGLAFNGPAVNSSMSFVNGAVSQSVGMTYQVIPSRVGEFVIPAIEVKVGGKVLRTEPIKLTVSKAAVQNDMQDMLFARLQMAPGPVFLGQTAPVNVVLFVRADVPLHGLAGMQAQADGLGYKNLDKVKQGTQLINGVSFNVILIEGAITPNRAGSLTFGPAVVKCQIRVQRRSNDIFEQFFNRFDVREVTVPVEPQPIEVLPLPTEGRPADFTGAVGQWNLEVTAKPTELNVGDPITLTIKVAGNGNIDLVPAPKVTGLDEFKTYDPTTKTTKNDLNTSGERVIQQVLVPKSTAIKQLPEVRLSFFDPVAKQYRTAVQPPINLVVKAGGSGQSTIVSGGLRLRPSEKLGQDIVYLKGDLGSVVASRPFCASPLFWVLNLTPVTALLGGIGWKQRSDRLRGDVAYARRSRAAKTAHKLLAAAAGYEPIQHALQGYLADRLNIPAGGITAAIVEEQLVPRGVAAELAASIRQCFETCDTARFAGGAASGDVPALRAQVEKLIDELEHAAL